MELGADFAIFVLVGLLGQLVDGALGMAYGLTCASVLMAQGMPPAMASASVHAAETFTSGISGASHAILGNVDRKLFWRLALPGMLGGLIGALLLSHAPLDWIQPLVVIYLLAMGVLVLVRAWRPSTQAILPLASKVTPLGFVAGLLDAIGGGGWGALNSSTLMARGHEPRFVIGSVNASEFPVTLTISIAFFTAFGIQHLDVVLGLLLGGLIGAPIAALLVRYLPARPVMAAVGILVIVLSLVQGWRWWHS